MSIVRCRFARKPCPLLSHLTRSLHACIDRMGDSPSQSLFASCSFYHYYPCVFTHLSTLMALAARSIKRSFNDSSLRRKYIGHLDVWGLCTKTFRSTACSELLIKCILRISFSLFTCLIHRNTLDRCLNLRFAFRQ